ncbi:MAG: PIN domain-containing protein [Mesorhizobium sp.]|nr:PIN domain-containing protein [Mesorhizobium sp.]MCO5161934.1 PIN domain-containing protein [Mesorhizobium sp.]
MLVSIDTNVLAYAEGTNDTHRRDIAVAVLKQLPSSRTMVAAQALGELFNVLTRKTQIPAQEARQTILKLTSFFTVLPTTEGSLDGASLLTVEHGLNIWDAIILAVSDAAGCRLLLSEDMQHGFEWRGVTVINPFLAEPHPLLRRALSG